MVNMKMETPSADKVAVHTKPSALKKLLPKTCTWEELAKHDNEADCWIAVDGKVYDVTTWLPTHPGGKDMILMAAGRDVTNLFESYHLTNKPTAILKKYYVCDISNQELPKYVSKSPFYGVLRDRINNHFEERGIDPKGGWKMWARLASIYVLLFAGFYLTHFYTANLLLSCFFALAFGVAEALFGMHILHDACHAAASHTPLLWRWMGSTFDYLIGAGYFSWMHQHVLGHHLYTNVRNADPDLGEGEVDFRRISPYQNREWYHKYQHIYAPLLYCLLSVKYRMQDIQVFTERKNGRIRVGTAPLFYVASYIVGKFTFVLWRIVLPYFFSPYQNHSLAAIFGHMILTEMVMGYYLTFFFQVSHVADGLEFLITPSEPTAAPIPIEEDWAVLQVRTTQDYSHGEPITTFLSGALNYQVVHHLFPTISQTYYTEIAPIVVQTCKEFGVEYQVLPNFFTAVASHISYLKKMGDPSSPVIPIPEECVDGVFTTYPTAKAPVTKSKKASSKLKPCVSKRPTAKSA